MIQERLLGCCKSTRIARGGGASSPAVRKLSLASACWGPGRLTLPSSRQPLARRASSSGSKTALRAAEPALVRCSLSTLARPSPSRPQGRRSLLSWPLQSGDRKRLSPLNVFRSRPRSISQRPPTKGFSSSLLSGPKPTKGRNRLEPPDGESGLGRGSSR